MEYISKTFLMSAFFLIFCALWHGMAIRVSLQDNAQVTVDETGAGEGLNLNETGLTHRLKRIRQAFIAEDRQVDATNASAMLGPVGARRYWFYSVIFAAAEYHDARSLMDEQVLEWDVDQLKLAHPIHEGTVQKTFLRALNAFHEIIRQSPPPGAKVLSNDQVDTLLESPGTMWGFVDPRDRKLLVMDGNGRAAALQWAFLSQCFSDLGVTVKVPVHSYLCKDPKFLELMHYLMLGLYECTDQKEFSEKIDEYFRTGGGCSEPLFGDCENAMRLRTYEGKQEALIKAGLCMRNFASTLNNTETADPITSGSRKEKFVASLKNTASRMKNFASNVKNTDTAHATTSGGNQSSDTGTKCDWKGFMGYLKTEHPQFTAKYTQWVKNRVHDKLSYYIDCVNLHEHECASEGIKTRDILQR